MSCVGFVYGCANSLPDSIGAVGTAFGGRFQFQRGMRDMFFGQNLFDSVFYRFSVLQRRDDHMGGEGVLGRTERPDMEVVYFPYPVYLQQEFAYLFRGDACGDPVQ